MAVFEILSPTTRQLDRSEKLQEYILHPNLTTIVHIDPSLMDVMVYSRGENGAWESVRLGKPEDAIQIAGLSVSLALSVVYEGIPQVSAPADKDSGQ